MPALCGVKPLLFFGPLGRPCVTVTLDFDFATLAVGERLRAHFSRWLFSRPVRIAA
jgi:hypothetical protein